MRIGSCQPIHDLALIPSSIIAPDKSELEICSPEASNTSSSLLSKFYTNTSLSIALSLSAAAWGLYWIPLRQIEVLGITSSWTVVIFNACPLIVLCPLFLFYFKSLKGGLKPTLYASLAIGMAFTFYANSLVETTVIRATLLFYLTPVWSTIFGVIWLSEVLTKARIVSITIAFIGLYLLLSNSNSLVSSFRVPIE